MSRGTRVFGVIGWPVAHSLSPVIHRAAFRSLGVDAVSGALPVRPEDLAAAVAGIRALGIGGVSVTAPHKEAVVAHLDTLDAGAEEVGAVNTIARDGDALVGHNTDRAGLRRFLQDAGVAVEGASGLILGAGGAARACALALRDLGIGRLTIAAREPAAARMPVEAEAIAFEDAAAVAADVVVNATPLGWHGERVPVVPRRGQRVIDLVYRQTPLLEAARAAGAEAHDGLGMLAGQAASAVEIWAGSAPDISAMTDAAVDARARLV